MTTVWPRICGRPWVTMRAMVSTGPPGGNGTIMRIRRSGYVCASAGAARLSVAIAAAMRVRCMSLDLDVAGARHRRPSLVLANQERAEFLRRQRAAADAKLGEGR